MTRADSSAQGEAGGVRVVTVVIPACNEQALLPAALQSVRIAAGHPALEGVRVLTVVAADSCTDGTASIAQEAGALVVPLRLRNVGRARAIATAAGLAALGWPVVRGERGSGDWDLEERDLEERGSEERDLEERGSEERDLEERGSDTGVRDFEARTSSALGAGARVSEPLEAPLPDAAGARNPEPRDAQPPGSDIPGGCGPQLLGVDAPVGRGPHLLGADTPGVPTSVWIASTDADSTVPPDWLAFQLARAAEGWEAVVGTVSVDRWPPHRPRTAARYHRLYEASKPPADLPWRHPHVHGANLGVAAGAYLAAGGFPPLALAEDHGLVTALDRSGARVLRTSDCPVTTSGRTRPRARGGFGDHLARLDGFSGVAELTKLGRLTVRTEITDRTELIGRTAESEGETAG